MIVATLLKWPDRAFGEYSTKASHQNFQHKFVAENTISKINTQGTTAQQKVHIKKLVEHAEEQRKKNMRSAGYKQMSLEDYIQNSRKRTMDYAEKWKDSDQFEDLAKIQPFSRCRFGEPSGWAMATSRKLRRYSLNSAEGKDQGF